MFKIIGAIFGALFCIFALTWIIQGNEKGAKEAAL